MTTPTTKDEICARRTTADGKHVCLWTDGSLTWALGYAIRGAWFQPKPENRDRAMRAGWLVLGDVEAYDASEVSDLVRAARWAVERDGLPGTMRTRMERKRLAAAMRTALGGAA